jgi:hypothetical protein
MSKATEPTEDTRRASPSTESRRRTIITPGELIVTVIFVGIVVALAIVLVREITLRHDVTNARAVSSKVVNDVKTRSGTAMRSLGSPTFQRTYTASALTKQFNSVKIATLKTPTLDQQIVVDTPDGRNIYFIYKYNALKVPFYVRTTIEHRSGHWYLTAVDGNIDESELTGGA